METYIDSVSLNISESSMRFAGFLDPANSSESIAFDYKSLSRIYELAEMKDDLDNTYKNFSKYSVWLYTNDK